MIEDLNYLTNQLREIHPDPFYRTSQSEFFRIKDSIVTELKETEAIDSFYFKAAGLVATLKDGHTSLLRPTFASSERLKNGSVIFPLKVIMREGRMYAVYDYKKSAALDTFQIVSINGLNTKSIMKKMLNVCSYDKYEDIQYSVLEGKFMVLFNELYGADEFYQIEMEINGQKRVKEWEGITYPDLVREMEKQTFVNYEMMLKKSEKTAKIRLGNFYPTQKLLHFMDSVFTVLKKEDIKELTIDVRGNSGGSSVMVDSLLNYLTDKPYRLYTQITLKISEPLKEKYRQRDSSFYHRIRELPIGSQYVIQPSLTLPVPKDNLFEGVINILSDRRTYSGASSFVHLIENKQLGKVMGETGGDKIYFGDFLLFKLPSSQLTVAIATKKFTEYTMEEPENPESRDN